jgi:hypothetical protein
MVTMTDDNSTTAGIVGQADTTTAGTAGQADIDNAPAEAAETPTEPTETAGPPDAPGDGAAADGGHPDEKWRQRFRQAEVQLTVEQARIAKINTRDAERHAAVGLADPTDLWRDGVTLADLLDDEGIIDPTLVEERVAQVLSAHPHWKRPSPVVGAPSSAVKPLSGPIPGGTQKPTWRDLLGGNATG